MYSAAATWCCLCWRLKSSPPGWVTKDEFLAGYGAAQAVPGPLFTFSSYLGTVMDATNPRWVGGLVALLAIYVPSFLLVHGSAALLGEAEGIHPGQTRA